MFASSSQKNDRAAVGVIRSGRILGGFLCGTPRDIRATSRLSAGIKLELQPADKRFMVEVLGRQLNPARGATGKFQRLRRSLREQLVEQPLRLLESRIREDHRFGLADGIRNEAILMKPVHGLPIKPFPRPVALMERQMEECEDGFIDFLGIDIHARSFDRD
jgi:hypothetical protein